MAIKGTGVKTSLYVGKDHCSEGVDMSEETQTDEYGILNILKRHKAEAALTEIEAIFNSFCDQYMIEHNEIRKAAFLEMVCCLQFAVIESKGNSSVLSAKIKEFIAQINEDIEQNND